MFVVSNVLMQMLVWKFSVYKEVYIFFF